MQKQSRKISIIATPMMIVCGLLLSGGSARADSHEGEGSCSNQTLRGDYGSTIEGVILSSPGVQLPFRGVVMAHYDGQGNLTQVDHVIFNGQPPATEWTSGTGTYHVNADCTGTAHIDRSTGDFLNLVFVVVRHGKEVHAVVTAPFSGPASTVISVSIRVEE